MYTFHIDTNKTYNVKYDIRIIKHRNNLLAIIPSTANWIVLYSSIQLDILNALVKGDSIQMVLNKFHRNKEDVNFVITQIEARRFFTKKVHNITDEKISLHLYLTNSCNLKCPHCYMFSGKKNENELSTYEILNLLKQFRDVYHGQQVILSGGEPTMRPDIVKIVSYASELGLETKLLTNGSFLSKEKFLPLLPFLCEVQISIDGYSEESNSSIRGKNHFQRALTCVEILISHGISTSIAITPTLETLQSGSEKYIIFVKELLEKYKGKSLEIKFTESLSSGRNINPSSKYNNEYQKIINSIQKNIYGDEYELIEFISHMRTDAIMNNCSYGSLSISSTGNVYLCPEIGQVSPIANIRTHSLSEIYTLAYKAEERSQITMLEPCNKCELLFICGGGCRIKEFSPYTTNDSINNVRKCSSVIKERFYKMMVESNEYLYRPLEK